MLTNVTNNTFDYLGETYTLPKQTTIKLQNFPRRLFSQALAPPNHDQKRYTFHVISFYEKDILRTAGIFSANPRAYKRYPDAVSHLKIKNLTKPQCIYLSSIAPADFREYIKLVKEEIKTSIKSS